MEGRVGVQGAYLPEWLRFKSLFLCKSWQVETITWVNLKVNSLEYIIKGTQLYGFPHFTFSQSLTWKLSGKVVLHYLIVFCAHSRQLTPSKWMRGKKVVTSPFAAIKSILMEFVCFQSAEIDIKCTCCCSPTKSDLSLAELSLQCQAESSTTNS